MTVEELKLDALKNALYHEDREQFFAKLHRWLMFFVITGGLATVATATSGHSYWLKFVGALVFLFGVLDIVFDTAGLARQHAGLRRRYYVLLAEAQRCPSRVPAKQLGDLNAQSQLIAADETPVAHGALANAFNEAHLAVGTKRDSKDLMAMNWFERFTRNMLPYSSTWFETVGEKDQRKKKRSSG